MLPFLLYVFVCWLRVGGGDREEERGGLDGVVVIEVFLEGEGSG
jgi:hypothetical protein